MYANVCGLSHHVVGTLRHLAAGLSTTAAGFGALSAVVHMSRVFLALSRAGFAEVGTKLTYVGGMCASISHERNRYVTDFGAVSVEPDAVHHHFHILLSETGFGTGVAAYGTILTGFDTILILLGS